MLQKSALFDKYLHPPPPPPNVLFIVVHTFIIYCIDKVMGDVRGEMSGGGGVIFMENYREKIAWTHLHKERE